MKTLLIFFQSLFLILSALGQSTPLPDSLTNNFVNKLNQLHKFRDSVSPLNKLDGILRFTFPKHSNIDGRWIYFSENANIEKINKPEVNKVIQEYSLYSAILTNRLGYHVNSSRNLILYDHQNSKIIQAVPMWYSDISVDFLRLFIGKSFVNDSSLLKFTYELQELLIIGSAGKFENTKYFDNKVTFDLTLQSSTHLEVWRHIEIVITNKTIKEFHSTNPKTGEIVIIR